MRIDIGSAFENEPPPLDFVLPGLLAGTVGALFSPGATGKSFLLLEAAMGIACGVAGGDLLGLKMHTGRVVYLAAEDPAPVLKHRVHAMGRHLPPAAREEVAASLEIECVIGKRMNLMEERQLEQLCKKVEGARLLVIDTISRVHTLDENSSSDMGQLLAALEYLSAESGAAVVFAHHVAKSAVRDGQGDQQHAARGSSALTDSARWGAALTRMMQEEAKKLSDDPTKMRPIGEASRHWYVRMSVPKNNYAEPIPDQWFVRGAGGVLVPATLLEVGGHPDSAAKTNSYKVGKDGGRNANPF
ncbi:MAG: AAA family ATPase [Burkholderiales bacterium]|nr:AAA family ATPase [Burkholderiales bacterium]